MSTTTFAVGDRVCYRRTEAVGTIVRGPHLHTNRSRRWTVRWDEPQEHLDLNRDAQTENVWEADLRAAK